MLILGVKLTSTETGWLNWQMSDDSSLRLSDQYTSDSKTLSWKVVDFTAYLTSGLSQIFISLALWSSVWSWTKAGSEDLPPPLLLQEMSCDTFSRQN